tara:strand:- start:1424 stop:1615 length:192 start_codon:yes stop_codon:yes gene_type:complete
MESRIKSEPEKCVEEIDKDFKSLLTDIKILRDDIHYIKIALLNGFIKKEDPECENSKSWWILS